MVERFWEKIKSQIQKKCWLISRQFVIMMKKQNRFSGELEKKEAMKVQLESLITKYKEFKSDGKLQNASEETIRTWINNLLKIFGWDVGNTYEIWQEKILSEREKSRLQKIGSIHTKPDYALKQGKLLLSFLDAKDLSVNLKKDKASAFQIRSYGWSAEVPCAFTSNFEEFCIFDCRFTPKINQRPDAGRIYLHLDEYLAKFDILYEHLLKDSVSSGQLKILYSDEKKIKGYKTLNIEFAENLSKFRNILAQHILEKNRKLINNDSLKLSYIVQVILDRIIFIRVCEARNIEREGLLHHFLETAFWEKFRDSSYMDFYEHYDGPLFSDNPIFKQIHIESDIFNDFINSLYYPTPYRFDVIPIKLLADVYEQFLVKKLKISGNKVVEEYKLDYQKTHGAISTPKYIVDDICKRTTKSLAKLTFINDLLKINILDPACGSGTFLISIFELFEKKSLEIFSNNNSEGCKKLCYKSGENYFLTVNMKKKIVENCIYGIDVDPEAVEVSKMSLALKIIDNNGEPTIYGEVGLFGRKILNGVGENIELGNTLVETDIYDENEDLIEDMNQQMLIRPYDLQTQKFKKIFENKSGFDFIVGNPPYVETKHYKKEVPLMHEYIRNKYSTFHGKADLSIIFIERCKNLLNPNGRLGFIVQKRFFKTDYGIGIRNLLVENKAINEIVDFISHNIFKGKITYVAILILDNCERKNISYLKVLERPELIEPAFVSNDFENNLLFTHESYDYKELKDSTWNFEDKTALEIKEKLKEKHGTLKNFPNIEIEGGIQVLWKKIYHIIPDKVSNGIISGKNGFGETVLIEENACRPVIYNRNFYCFRDLFADAYAIFPYEISDSKKGIPFSKFNDMFPLAGIYLLKNKERIIENVITNRDESWHLFTRVLNHDSYDKKKIAIPMTAKDTYAAIDTVGNSYVDNANVWFISVDNIPDDVLVAIGALINSTVFSVLARLTANPQSGGYMKLNKQFLSPIPFPSVNLLSDKKRIKVLNNLTRKIIDEQNRYIKASLHERGTISGSIRSLWKKLDQTVEQLYCISKSQSVELNKIGRTEDRIEILRGE